jgi:hypothetical protein
VCGDSMAGSSLLPTYDPRTRRRVRGLISRFRSPSEMSRRLRCRSSTTRRPTEHRGFQQRLMVKHTVAREDPPDDERC